MGIMLWDLPPGWTMASKSAGEAEEARLVALQREASERADEMVASGIRCPEGVDERVAFIERHGARVYLALMEPQRCADPRDET